MISRCASTICSLETKLYQHTYISFRQNQILSSLKRYLHALTLSLCVYAGTHSAEWSSVGSDFEKSHSISQDLYCLRYASLTGPETGQNSWFVSIRHCSNGCFNYACSQLQPNSEFAYNSLLSSNTLQSGREVLLLNLKPILHPKRAADK